MEVLQREEALAHRPVVEAVRDRVPLLGKGRNMPLQIAFLEVAQGDVAPEDAPPAVTFEAVYDIHPDGDRFLMIRDLEEGDVGAIGDDIIVVENFFEELKRIAPIPESS